MRIGIMIGADRASWTLDEIVQLVRQAEAAGLDDVWMANIFSFDAIGALTVAGRETRRIALGTAVTPTYPRHPTAMAQQALTAAAASANRFTLGIGVSHQIVIEDMLGLSYAQPARHMREYLEVLVPLLRGETVQHAGPEFRVAGVGFDTPGTEPVPVVVAALGPRMLEVAGALADGTHTWMVGPRTLAAHIIPRLTAAAAAAGRPAPRVVAGFPLVITNQPDAARAALAKTLKRYGERPSYRAMLEREGAAGPADVAIIGDEAHARAELERLRALGVTHFNAAIMRVEDGAHERALAFLAGVVNAFRAGGTQGRQPDPTRAPS